MLRSPERGEKDEDSIEYLTEWPVNNDTPPAAGSRNKRRLTRHHFSANPINCDTKRVCVDTPTPLITADHTLLPDVLLSRWWKSIDKPSLTHHPPTSSSNPRTLLYHIARLPEGQAILKQRISVLQLLLAQFEGCPEEWSVHYNLAVCYQRLGPSHTQHALHHAIAALRGRVSGEEREEVEWILELLNRQAKVEERKCMLERQLVRMKSLTLPEPVEVERRCASELSVEEFLRDYALTHTPLIITGLVGHMTSTPWTLDYMNQRLGDRVVPLRQRVEGSVEWARLESAGECGLQDYLHSLNNNNREQRYLFDWGLPLHCPELVCELSIPKYFASDYLQATPEGSLYRDSWPSLFIAPPGLVSDLHVDTFGSNFWMALFEGRKRWLFFPPEDTPLLYPVYTNSTDAVFEVNLSSPDLQSYPLLSLTHPRTCTLGPGEVLYVPAGSPHRVENLEKSLAISANFVDSSNFELVKKELSASSLVDQRARQLLGVMEEPGFGTRIKGSVFKDMTGMNTEQDILDVGKLCVSWKLFKH